MKLKFEGVAATTEKTCRDKKFQWSIQPCKTARILCDLHKQFSIVFN